MPRKILLLAALVLATASVSLSQTLKQLKHQPPDGAILTFQMTDGTVIAQGGNDSDWWKLTPDITGSYVNGTWKQLASLPTGYVPDAFASAVLADGRLVIVGGEYNSGNFALTNQGAIYDPSTNVWTSVTPPKSWGYIGDSPAVVLPSGKFLVGNKLTKSMAALDPKTLTWKSVSSAGKADFDAEEGWTLLPNGTILTADVKDAPNSEIYTPSAGAWASAGSTIVDLHSPSPFGCINYGPNGSLCYYPPGEIGPAILRPDGTVFATGSYSNDGSGPGHTAIYSPTAGWSVGPNFPNGDNAGDSFAVLLTNGNVLVEGDTGTSYVFDGTTLTPGVAIPGCLMVLPTGQVLVGGSEVYTSSGTYQPGWAPAIHSVPTTVVRGSTYKITGTQFNGLSQAAAFGDEYQTATNYPLVRITNNSTGHVFYAKTHDHSTMGVATGTKAVFTNFDVPAGMETGASSLVVVANGIPSLSVSITVN
ncbi:MAG: kelch repeat-containing protein [Candidatus Sulfotelmatobacter sp.]